MNSLYEKYGIVHIEGCRYYIVDLKAKEVLFENTLPYCCVINRVALYDSSWNGMILKVAEELDRLNPKSEEELLQIKNTWGKQEVFGTAKKSNYRPFKGIFINLNHTAVHAMWTIQLLLNEYQIDLDNCKFLLRRLPLAEPKEIREYEKNTAVQEFREYLGNEYQRSEEECNAIVNCIEMINAKILPSIARGYYDLFLFETPQYYQNYSGKALKIIKEKTAVSNNYLKIIEYSIDKLGEYIKIRFKNKRINNTDYSILSDTKSKDALPDFDDFDNF